MIEGQKEKKQRNYKREVAYGSTPYAFRLSGKTEDAYRKQLNTWITELRTEDQLLSPSQALREVIKGLVDKCLGHSLAYVNQDNPVDVETLKQGIMDELKVWLTDTLSSPEKAAHLAHVSNQAVLGASIDDDVISNILEDFGR